MSRDWLRALGLGALAALALGVLQTGAFGAVVLAYLAPLPLFYAGLTMGLRWAAVATAVGAIGALTLTPEAVVSYALTTAVPVMVLTRQALLFRASPDGRIEWYPPGLLLAWLSGLAAAGFVGAVIWTLDAEGGLPGILGPRVEAVLTALQPPTEGASLNELVPMLAEAMPALLAVTWILVTSANGALAQGLAMRFGRNIRPGAGLSTLMLPGWLAGAFVATGLGGMLLPGYGAFVGESLAVIFGVPFFLQGLGCVHALAGRTSMKGLVLAGFYLLLVVSGVLALLVVALGLIEQWAGLRRRFGAGPGKED